MACPCLLCSHVPTHALCRPMHSHPPVPTHALASQAVAELRTLRGQHEAALEMLGEKEEKLQELQDRGVI